MFRRITALFLTCILLLSCLLLASCGGDGDKETEPATDEVTGDLPETDAPATGGDTDPTDTAVPDTGKETEPATEEVLAPTGFTDPLTGLPTTEALSKQRPIAVMIGNTYKALPQPGIGEFDVMYECLAEGGITRLLFLTTDYRNLSTFGSIRSARDYFVDFVQNHDAIYIHAGGSTFAYVAINAQGIDSLDSVNMYWPASTDVFYQDPDRLATMSSEHTTVSDGQRIANGIEYKKYETERSEGSTASFSFVEYGKTVELAEGEDAKHIVIPYTATQFPQYIYNTESGRYDRFQFKGEKHVDGTTGEQLSFDNVLILTCTHKNLNDELGHIDVTVLGEGNGYYAAGGKYIRILWSKESHDAPLMLTDLYGNPLQLNCGKTAVNIISPAVKAKLVMNNIEE